MSAKDSSALEAHKLERHLLSTCSDAVQTAAHLAFYTLDRYLVHAAEREMLYADLERRLRRLFEEATASEQVLLMELIATRGLHVRTTAVCLKLELGDGHCVVVAY